LSEEEVVDRERTEGAERDEEDEDETKEKEEGEDRGDGAEGGGGEESESGRRATSDTSLRRLGTRHDLSVSMLVQGRRSLNNTSTSGTASLER
jgi:hypothetical protein